MILNSRCSTEIRTDLQRQLVRDGYRLRIYIPYGRDWFPYVMRRPRGTPRQPDVLSAQFPALLSSEEPHAFFILNS